MSPIITKSLNFKIIRGSKKFFSESFKYILNLNFIVVFIYWLYLNLTESDNLYKKMIAMFASVYVCNHCKQLFPM